MSIRAAHKSANFGRELINLQRRGQNAIDTLQELRSRLPALRTAINGDPDLPADEKANAVAEVDAAATDLVQQIQDFTSSL